MMMPSKVPIPISPSLIRDDSDCDDDSNELMDNSPSVVLGEAPESDEDELYLNDDAPETPPSPSPDYTSEDFERRRTADSSRGDSLLHRKLKEKNELFREEIVKMACQPYVNATKEIDCLTNQLIKSQKMVVNVSCSLRKIARDLMQVENSLDALNLNRRHIPTFTDSVQSPDCHESPKKDHLALNTG
ncbi:uncharacterized protein LOC141856697 [Brevipalpus obovatus]|uniref:uncharacterized protein LOC141856697 n=1 Tax=Brevipalpus obovatus TaxID=246614 RepID=UPI003D9EF7AA